MTREEQLLLQGLVSLEEKLQQLKIHKNKSINIFAAVGMSRQEVKHSAFLAWLLTPFASGVQHGMGNKFLKHWLELLFMHPNTDQPEPELKSNRQILSGAGISSMDDFAPLLSASDVVVETERVILDPESRIDIMITSKSAQTVIVIENKVGTTTHDEQLTRYEQKEVNQNAAWNGWKKVFVYLTPFGDHPYEYRAEAERDVYNPSWCVYSYGTILQIVREMRAELGKSRAQTKLKLLMEDYIQMVNSEILQRNGELRSACKRIVRQYRAELELLAAYTKDNLSEILDCCNGKLEQIFDMVVLNRTENRLEFVTKKIAQFFGEELCSDRSPYPVCIRIAAMKGDIDITLFLENANGLEGGWTERQRQFASLAGVNTAGKNKYCTILRKVLLPEQVRQGEFTEEQKLLLEAGLESFGQMLLRIEERLSRS